MIQESSDIIITVRIPRDLDANLTAIAEADERTKAAVIRLAIREYLDHREK